MIGAFLVDDAASDTDDSAVAVFVDNGTRVAVVIIGQLGFAYDGETLYVRLLAPGRVAGPHVSVEADRLRINRSSRERTARRKALEAASL